MKSNKPNRTEQEMSQATVNILVNYYLGDLKRRGFSDETVDTRRRSLGRMLEHLSQKSDSLRLLDVTHERIFAYVDELQGRAVRYSNHPNRPPSQGPLSPYTIRKEVSIMKAFGNWLGKEGFVNPFEELPVPKVPKAIKHIITNEEKQKIFDSINLNTAFGARLAAMLALMMGSGLRIGEVVGAKLSNLDLEHCRLKVFGKGSKERIVPFDGTAAKLILRYITIYRPKPASTEIDHVFLAMDGKPLTRGGAESIMRRVKQATGIKRLHAHLLRHTFVTDYLLEGGDPMDVKDIVGHTSLEVTKLYRHIQERQINERFQHVSPFDKVDIGGLRRFGNKKKKTAP